MRCDTERGSCVECTDNADCKDGDRLVCDRIAGRCLGCRDDVECGAARVCDLGTHGCKERCSAVRPCSRGTCDLASGHCIECTPGTGCSGEAVCSVGSTCVDCVTDSDCRSNEERHCDTLLGRCVGCLIDTHCPAPQRCSVRDGECSSF
jgi:hypothetical protein